MHPLVLTLLLGLNWGLGVYMGIYHQGGGESAARHIAQTLLPGKIPQGCMYPG